MSRPDRDPVGGSILEEEATRVVEGRCDLLRIHLGLALIQSKTAAVTTKMQKLQQPLQFLKTGLGKQLCSLHWRTPSRDDLFLGGKKLLTISSHHHSSTRPSR